MSTYEKSEQRRAELIARESSKPGYMHKIYAKCIECIFDPEGGGGTWPQQVEACTATSCPLYSVRPRSRPETEAAKKKRLAREQKEEAA
jgi:hypothetical protein